MGTYTNETKVGDVDGGNYTKINKFGKRYKGTSTVWKDMIADIFGSRLNSVAGKVDYDFDENAIIFQKGGVMATVADRVSGNQEINHEFKVGTGITFKPHMHRWQQVTSGAVKSYVFEARWRIQNNNSAKTTARTTIYAYPNTADDIFDFTGEVDGLYNQITRFDDIVVNCGISDTIQFQITRTDSETEDVSVYFYDLHGEVDSDGSEDEISKLT